MCIQVRARMHTHSQTDKERKLLLHTSRLGARINMMISIEIFNTTNTVQMHVACVLRKLQSIGKLLTLQLAIVKLGLNSAC